MGLTHEKKNWLIRGSYGLNALGFAALAVAALQGCGHGSGSGSASDVVATVNGVPISNKDFEDALIRKDNMAVQTGQGVQQAPLPAGQNAGMQTLRDVVNRQLTLNLAKELGVMPTADDIDNEVKFISIRQPGYLQQNQQAGVGLDAIKIQIEERLARFNVVTKGITVTPSDVDAFIKQNPDKFRNPPQARCLYVLVASPLDKSNVDKELNTGQDFSNVALRYSKAAEVRTRGVQYGIVNLDAYPSVVKQSVEATTEGKTTPWITVGANTFVKFYVQAKVAASPIKIDAPVRELVKRSIMEDRGNKAMDFSQRILAQFKKSKIDVQIDALKPSWKAFSDQINQVQQAGVSPTQAPGIAPGTAPGK